MSKHTRHNSPKNKNTHSKLGRMKNQGWDIYKMDIKLRDKYLDSWNQNYISCLIIIVITKKKKMTSTKLRKQRLGCRWQVKVNKAVTKFLLWYESRTKEQKNK